MERFTHLDGVEIKALCDLYPERVDSAQAILARRGFPSAAAYSGEEGWKQLCERGDIDLVYIVTPWQKHVPMAVYAMKQGKHGRRGGSRRHVARRVLAAGEHRREDPAPLA